MKNIIALLLVSLVTSVSATEYDTLIKNEIKNISDIYSDGYATLKIESIKSKVLRKQNDGYCFIITSFNMEGYFNVQNISQYIVLLECNRNSKTQPNKDIYVSSVFPFMSPKVFLDVDTATFKSKRSIEIFSKNNKAYRLFERKRTRWWSLIE